LVQPRRGLAEIYPDVVVEECHQDELQITEHPMEQGAAISDHAFKKPMRVTIRAGVSDSSPDRGEGGSKQFYEQLLDLQAKREPFDISTGKRLYKNMLIESITATSSVEAENSLQFTAECREVIIVTAQTAKVPPASRHSQPKKTAPTTDKGQQNAAPKSMLLTGAGQDSSGGGGFTRPQP
jgi:hypothetical protein